MAAHKHHPAVLMWAIANEGNASWNYGSKLSDFLSLVNEMAREAHLEEGFNFHPVTVPLADTDFLQTVGAFDPLMPHLDLWSVNVYRGASFGNLFEEYRKASAKPLAILEYGIDAYDDNAQAEYEAAGSPYQALYAQALWKEIAANSAVCVGGTVMNYSDEWWKGKYGRTDAGHPGCPDHGPAFHSACGYATGAHPDGYCNEEWWGVMRTLKSASGPDQVQPRAVYHMVKEPAPSPQEE